MAKRDFIYANQVSRFEFLHIPQALLEDPEYKEISNEAKLLYGYMLKRTTTNPEVDEQQRAFINCTVDEAASVLRVSKPTAAKALEDLEKVHLIEKYKRGLGQPNSIYVREP